MFPFFLFFGFVFLTLSCFSFLSVLFFLFEVCTYNTVDMFLVLFGRKIWSQVIRDGIPQLVSTVPLWTGII